MKDPIERADAIEVVKRQCKIAWENWHETRPSAERIIEDLKELPSAQPEIIRCKECKWSDWYTSVDGKRYCYCMETGNGGRTENDFCSYAERQEE